MSDARLTALLQAIREIAGVSTKDDAEAAVTEIQVICERTLRTYQPYQGTPQPFYSAWGTVQTAKELAPGVWDVTTESHGGIILSDERVKALPAWARGIRTYAGLDNHFEEDCDWCIVALAFPDVMEAKQQNHRAYSVLRCALMTLKGTHPAAYDRYVALHPEAVAA